MKRCLHCHGDNEDSAVRCRACGGVAFVKLNPDAARSQSSRRTLPLVVVIVLGFGVFSLLGSHWLQRGKLARLEQQHADERARSEQQHKTAVEQEDAARRAQIVAEEAGHRALLLDPNAISGALARERHQKEWARRLAHDPQFARTANLEELSPSRRSA